MKISIRTQECARIGEICEAAHVAVLDEIFEDDLIDAGFYPDQA